MVRSVNQLQMMTRKLGSASNVAGRLSASGSEPQCDRLQIGRGKVVLNILGGCTRTACKKADQENTASHSTCCVLDSAGPVFSVKFLTNWVTGIVSGHAKLTLARR